MAAFPTVKYEWSSLGVDIEPVVARQAMERGIPKQRRVNSDVRVELDIAAHFDTKVEALAFETWFFTDINAGQDFFDFTCPYTGAAVQARIVGGAIGKLSFLQRTLEASKRSFKLEYWRSTW